MVVKQHHPTRPRLSPFPTRWRRWPSPPQPCASWPTASISPNTRRAYLGALARLDAWRGAEPLTDSVLAAYLGAIFEQGRAPASAALAVAAARFRPSSPASRTPPGKPPPACWAATVARAPTAVVRPPAEPAIPRPGVAPPPHGQRSSPGRGAPRARAKVQTTPGELHRRRRLVAR